MRFKPAFCLVPRHLILLTLVSVTMVTYGIYITGTWQNIPFPVARFGFYEYKLDQVDLVDNRSKLPAVKVIPNEESVTGGIFKSTFNDPATTEASLGLTLPEGTPILRENDEVACVIPKLNPLDPSVQKFNVRPSPANCENDHPLIFETDFNSTLIQVKNPETFGFTSCCYVPFGRKRADSQVVPSKKCYPIVSRKTVISDEFISIRCNKSDDTGMVTKTVDMFGLIHLKPEVEKRITNLDNKLGQAGGKSNGRRVNVVVLGIDAVSHMNLLRTMPETYEYLMKNLSAIGLNGYTKVGDNTFPNIVPVTTGLSVEELKSRCWKSPGTPFDKCPFIWKAFAEEGYRTAYGEDAVWMGIFNYQKRGFSQPPTDYYYNPLTYLLEKQLGHHHLLNAKMCYGPRIGFHVSLNFLQKMAFQMNRTRRYFQFIWATSLFHDYLNQGKLSDAALKEMLQWFKIGGYLEDTVFVLMSDHGIRWGGIRSTLQGKMEERMPFLYFIFPEWFKENYRSAVSNLIRNRERLTSPYDLHETLLDLLHLENIDNNDMKRRYKYVQGPVLPRGISLFLPIPPTRTCKDASIEDHWCVCQSSISVNITGNSIIEEAARSIVHRINGMFIGFPQCATLSLNRILNAQVLQTENKKVADKSSVIRNASDPRLNRQQFTCSVSLSVLPSNATFEGVATRRTDGSWEVSGEISRTNLYGDQSRCVTDYNLKKFCYCPSG